jgi:hypothetical protein
MNAINIQHTFPSAIKTLFNQSKTALHNWYWDVVLLPFLMTRLAWVLVASFSHYFLPDPSFSRYTQRGWFLSPTFLIDIWCRWDAKWYLSIVTKGYVANSNITNYLSNLAFFPLYPYLVKPIGWIFPRAQSSQSIYLLFGIILSNLFFLAAAGLLYKLVVNWIADETIARNTLLLLFVFPTSFYFSCFYSESLFLFLSLASLMAGLNQKWWLAGLLGALCTLSRSPGILMIIPIFWLYMNSRKWQIRRMRGDVLWLLLLPVALSLFFLSLYPKTGSFWSPLLAQAAWGRGGDLGKDLLGLIQSPALNPRQMDAVFWIIFLLITLVGMWKLPSRFYGVYALAQLALPISSGTFFSASRLIVVIFPVFIMLAQLLRKPPYMKMMIVLFFTLQIVYFLGWVNYYWIA